MSSGFPRRRRGICRTSGSITSFGTAFIISVSVIPGATALTRIPLGPSSRARDTVSPLTANLEVGYARPLAWPEILTMDEVERITPLPLAIIHSLAARVAVKIPFTFRSMTRSYVSSVYSVKGVLSETPALFTRISTQPYFSVTFLNSFRTDSRLERLGLIPSTTESGYSSFKRAALFFAFSSELAVIMTLAPSCKNLSAVAKPIPRLPPVMIATLSFNLIYPPSLG